MDDSLDINILQVVENDKMIPRDVNQENCTCERIKWYCE